MTTPENEFQEAVLALNQYYEALTKRMATEIAQNAKVFESAEEGEAERIIEKYAQLIDKLRPVYSLLRRRSRVEKPTGQMPLGKDEFRCFGCGAVIRQQDELCRICGWTWR